MNPRPGILQGQGVSWVSWVVELVRSTCAVKSKNTNHDCMMVIQIWWLKCAESIFWVFSCIATILHFKESKWLVSLTKNLKNDGSHHVSIYTYLSSHLCVSHRKRSVQKEKKQLFLNLAAVMPIWSPPTCSERDCKSDTTFTLLHNCLLPSEQVHMILTSGIQHLAPDLVTTCNLDERQKSRVCVGLVSIC